MARAQPVADDEPVGPSADRERRGIQSIEVGGEILKALAGDAHPMALRDLAKAAHREFKRPPKPDDQTEASCDGTSVAMRSSQRCPF